jgi:hypothetical protein
MQFKTPLYKKNLAISIQDLTLSESGGFPHEPQTTLIQAKSGHFHTNPYPLEI